MKRLLPLMAMLVAAGCTPDRWYAVERAPAAAVATVPAAETAAPPATDPATVEADPAPTHLPLTADGGLRLRVEDAVLLAVAHNRDLRAKRYDSTIAATFEAIERGRYDPELFAGVAVGEARAASFDSLGVRSEEDSSSLAAEVGLRQELPTGTDIEVRLSQANETADGDADTAETRVGLSVTQALLRGAGPAVNMADIRQAALDADISRYELRAYVEALIAATETAYWNLAEGERQIAVVGESLRVAELQLADVEARIDLGASPRSAAAAIRAEVARRRQALIEARYERDQAQLVLQRLVTPGQHLDFDRALALDSDPAIEPGDLGRLDDHIALALQQRPEIGEARLQLAQRRLATVVTANGVLPRLDFFVGLGATGYGDDSGSSAADLSGDDYDLRVGIDFSYDLGQRSANARHVAAIASRRQAEAAIDNLLQLVEFEVRQAWNSVDRAARQLNASQITARLQEETLRAEQERLDAGAGTSLAVAQAQRDLLEAQVAEVASAAAYRIALVALFRAEGSLLERRGVRVLE